MKTYCAIIWTNDPSRAGERVRVAAATLQEAKQKLEAEHGKGTVFDLHNEDDAGKARSGAEGLR